MQSTLVYMSSSHWKFIKWFELKVLRISDEGQLALGCAVSPLPLERSGSPNIRYYKRRLTIFVYTRIVIHPLDNTRAQTGAFSDGRSMVGQDARFFMFHFESPSWRVPSIKGGVIFLTRQEAPRECTCAQCVRKCQWCTVYKWDSLHHINLATLSSLSPSQ